METVHHVITKFIPESTECYKRIHFKHYYYCKRRKLKTIFNFNNLKWLRLQKEKKKNFLVWIIFIEVGVDYFLEVLLQLKGEKNNFPWDFQGFPRSVWTTVFKRLSSNNQVKKIILQAPKKFKNNSANSRIQEPFDNRSHSPQNMKEMANRGVGWK